jgi:hypothetical protein
MKIVWIGRTEKVRPKIFTSPCEKSDSSVSHPEKVTPGSLTSGTGKSRFVEIVNHSVTTLVKTIDECCCLLLLLPVLTLVGTFKGD